MDKKTVFLFALVVFVLASLIGGQAALAEKDQTKSLAYSFVSGFYQAENLFGQVKSSVSSIISGLSSKNENVFSLTDRSRVSALKSNSITANLTKCKNIAMPSLSPSSNVNQTYLDIFKGYIQRLRVCLSENGGITGTSSIVLPPITSPGTSTASTSTPAAPSNWQTSGLNGGYCQGQLLPAGKFCCFGPSSPAWFDPVASTFRISDHQCNSTGEYGEWLFSFPADSQFSQPNPNYYTRTSGAIAGLLDMDMRFFTKIYPDGEMFFPTDGNVGEMGIAVGGTSPEFDVKKILAVSNKDWGSVKKYSPLDPLENSGDSIFYYADFQKDQGTGSYYALARHHSTATNHRNDIAKVNIGAGNISSLQFFQNPTSIMPRIGNNLGYDYGYEFRAMLVYNGKVYGGSDRGPRPRIVEYDLNGNPLRTAFLFPWSGDTSSVVFSDPYTYPNHYPAGRETVFFDYMQGIGDRIYFAGYKLFGYFDTTSGNITDLFGIAQRDGVFIEGTQDEGLYFRVVNGTPYVFQSGRARIFSYNAGQNNFTLVRDFSSLGSKINGIAVGDGNSLLVFVDFEWLRLNLDDLTTRRMGGGRFVNIVYDSKHDTFFGVDCPFSGNCWLVEMKKS